MPRIPETVTEYRQRHKKAKSIRWAIKYYNDNYIYTEWDKPPGKYVRKNTPKTRGFRRKNKVLLLYLNQENEIQNVTTEAEVMRQLL